MKFDLFIVTVGFLIFALFVIAGLASGFLLQALAGGS